MIVNVYVDCHFYSLIDTRVAPSGIVSHQGPMAVLGGVYFPMEWAGGESVVGTVRLTLAQARLAGLPVPVCACGRFESACDQHHQRSPGRDGPSRITDEYARRARLGDSP